MTEKDESTLRYVAYVRKSEKGKEAQVFSHKGQARKIKEKYPTLKIVRWMEPESQSAFEPGRPVFNEMIEFIKAGKADGIVAYCPNRISRNEIDAATVTYALRKNAIKDIKFVTNSFENTPEGIKMLQSELNQGQYESAVKGRDIKRGMEDKVRITGEKPGNVPQGYLKEVMYDEYGKPVVRNKRYATQTVNDPIRYDLVKQMWKMFTSGMYTPAQIRKIANEDWGYLTPQTKETGGIPLYTSAIYSIFNNVFYAGYIEYKSELIKGSHEPMITLEEYDYAQKLLGEKGKLRHGSCNHTYGSLIRCGVCGCLINGKNNKKYIKRDNADKIYTHYYCPRKSEKKPCDQSIYTSIEKLEQDIDKELQKYTILPEFRDLAVKILRRENKIEVKERKQVYKSLQSKRENIQEQLDSLLRLKLRDKKGELMDDEEYAVEKAQLKNDLLMVDDKLRATEKRAEEWMELTEQAFDFATYATIRFRTTTDPMVKRHILETLGANFQLKDNQLTLTPNEWLVPIGEQYSTLEKAYLRVRTNKRLSTTEVELKMNKIFQSWYTRRDSNTRPLAPQANALSS